jgi:hypothetical protein
VWEKWENGNIPGKSRNGKTGKSGKAHAYWLSLVQTMNDLLGDALPVERMSAADFALDNLPDSPEKDEILGLLRVMAAWKKNHCGRRPGAVHKYLMEVADGLGDNLSFDALVLELRYRLLRGHGNYANSADGLLDDVDTAEQTVTWCEPGKDCRTMPFSTLANKWTKVRKIKLSNVSR